MSEKPDDWEGLWLPHWRISNLTVEEQFNRDQARRYLVFDCPCGTFTRHIVALPDYIHTCKACGATVTARAR